jgi:transposase InsO family protein
MWEKNKNITILYMDKEYREVLKNKKILDSIFYDKGFLMKNLPLFVKKIRGTAGHNIPYRVIESYYNHQPVVQRFKPHIENRVPHHIISLLPFERIYCDTMYLTQKNSVLAFINIVDLFSKYGFSRCYTIKSKTSSISSEKAKITINEFFEEIKQYNIPVGIIYTDRGSEFCGEFEKNLQEKKIIQVYGNAGDKRKTSPIERFNGTIRLYIEKFKIVYGSINSHILDIIIKSYNNIPHAKLKYSPIEILKNKKYQDEITSINYAMQKEEIKEVPLTGYVRVLLQTGTFKKISPIWSHEIYKIKNYSSGNNYTLEGGNKSFKRDELLPVKRDILEPEIDNDLIKKERVYIPREKVEEENKKYNTRGGRVQVKFV